jgi:phosphopantothenoylcysteine decarboxylase/phosphopantothenate--cysteine ligase
VGFAAETEDVVENARRKLASKKVAMIVGNRAQDAFGAEGSELVVVDAGGVTPLPHAGKLAQARRLIAEIATRLGRR